MGQYSYETWGQGAAERPREPGEDGLYSESYCNGFMRYGHRALSVHVDTVLGSCYDMSKKLRRVGDCITTTGLPQNVCDMLALYVSYHCELVGDKKDWHVGYIDSETGERRAEYISQPHIVYDCDYDEKGNVIGGGFAMVDMSQDEDAHGIRLRTIETIVTQENEGI